MYRNRVVTSLGLLLALAPLATAEDQASVTSQFASDTLIYVEMAGSMQLKGMLDQTELLELWLEEELQDFLEPAMEGIREDLEYMMNEAPGIARERLFSEDPFGHIAFGITRLEIEEDDDEPKAMELIASVQMNSAEDLFNALRDYLLKEEADETEVSTVAGRPALINTDNDDGDMRIVLDGDRIVMQVVIGEDGYGDFFDRQGDGLEDNSDFQAVRQAVGADQALMFAYVNFAGAGLELLKSGMQASSPGKEGEALARVMTESPTMQQTRALGYAIGPDQPLLRDRFYILAPGDRSEWGKTGAVGDAVTRHAALCDPDSDLFVSVWFDVPDSLEQSAKEHERTEKIFREMDLDMEKVAEMNVQAKVIEAIEEATGIDVEDELAPVFGNHASMFMSVPSAGLAIPDFGLVMDLKDPEGFDAILVKLLQADDQLEEVNFLQQEHEGRELTTVKLVGAGLPLLPTLCRLDNQLLICTTGQSMRSLLRSIGEQDTLASAERFQEFQQTARVDGSSVMWCDMGSSFQYLYGFVGLGLSAMRMQGAEMGERFDASLLPTGDMFSERLGIGTFASTQNETGLTYEGRSTLGNPVVGMMSGVLSVVGLIGISEGTREKAADMRTDDSKDNLRELTRSMEAYRASVGGGSYPSSLVKLVDRGLLTDRSKLVDPSDPKPKKSRTGSGDRIPVSYAIASVEVLPENVRERLPDDCTQILHTRGPWHERWSDKTYLVIALGDDDASVRHVDEDEWAR